MLFDLQATVAALAGAMTGESKIALLGLAVVVGAILTFKLTSRGIKAGILRAVGRKAMFGCC